VKDQQSENLLRNRLARIMLEKDHSIDLLLRLTAADQILALAKTSHDGQVHTLGHGDGTRKAIGKILSSINIDDEELPDALIRQVNIWPRG
jgi:hypothetical protein